MFHIEEHSLCDSHHQPLHLKVVFHLLQAQTNTEEGVAPTVERWTPNPTVVGSNPIALTFYLFPAPKLNWG